MVRVEEPAYMLPVSPCAHCAVTLMQLIFGVRSLRSRASSKPEEATPEHVRMTAYGTEKLPRRRSSSSNLRLDPTFGLVPQRPDAMDDDATEISYQEDDGWALAETGSYVLVDDDDRSSVYE